MTLAKLSNGYRNSSFPSFPSLLDRFFEGDLMDWNNWNFTNDNSTLPAVNVTENENEYAIEVAAPGLKKNDFKVSYENGRLTISAEKQEEKKEKEKGKVTRREFSYRSFQRSFTVLETEVDADKIKANYADGILHLTLPKKEEAKPKPARQIAIG